MGGKSKTTQTSAYTPNETAMAAYESLFPQLKQVAETAWNPATAQQVAGFNPQQMQSFNQISDLQGVYQPYLNQATNFTQGAAAPISSEAIQGYMNPYQQQVIDATMAQLSQQQGQQVQNLNAGAMAQNALGGNRADIARGYLQGQQNLATGSTVAGLNQANYGQALSAAQQDAIRQLSAGQQMGSLGQLSQNLGLQGAQALYGAGAAQQAQQQAEFNAGTQNAQAQTMWPYQNLQWLSSLYGGLGPLMGGTTSGTSKTSQGMGAGSMIGAGIGLLSMFSDKRLKEDAQPIGKSFDGQTIYKFRYKGHPQTHIGMMAQEVERKHPEAVGNIGGLKTVNYDAATADAADRKHFADGGGAFNYSSFFPWASITPGKSTVPQLAQEQGQSKDQGGQGNLSELMKLGKQARGGLGNILSGLGGDTSGLEGSSIGTGFSDFGSGLGSLFGFANGGTPRLAFADGGDIDLGGYAGDFSPQMSSSEYMNTLLNPEPSYLAKAWQNLTSPSDPRPIWEKWAPPPLPERNPAFYGGMGLEEPGFKRAAETLPPPLPERNPAFYGGMGLEEPGFKRAAEISPPQTIGMMIPGKPAAPNFDFPLTAPPVEVGPMPKQTGTMGLLPDTENIGEVGPMPKTITEPSTYTSISPELETNKRNRLQGAGYVNEGDTGKIPSYGNFGLRSGEGGSLEQFLESHGSRLGFTAPPDTQEFTAQWRQIARDNPVALHAAEMDWYYRNIAGDVGGNLQKIGVPPEVAADPRVQTYFGDRSVQQGPGSTRKHAARVREAYEASGNDPEKFLLNLSDLDKRAIDTDFRSYLKENPGHRPGLENRVTGRLEAALRIGAEPTQLAISPTGAAPQAIVPARSVAMPQIAPAAGGVSPALATQGARPGAPKEGFGLLSGLGIDFNPLNLSEEKRRQMFYMGLGMMGNTMQPWAGGMEGLKTAASMSAQDRQNALAAAQIALEAHKIAQPVKIGQQIDAWGNVRDVFGAYNPKSGTYEPTPLYGGPGTAGQTGSNANVMTGMSPDVQAAYEQNLRGEDFKAVLPPQDRADVQAALDGRTPPPLNSSRNQRWQRLMSYAQQIDPAFDASRYSTRQTMQKNMASGGFYGKQVTFSNTTLDHLYKLWDTADSLGNTDFTPYNSVKNWINQLRGKPEVDKFNSQRNNYIHELEKLFAAGAGSVTTKERMIKDLNDSKSPIQMKEVMRGHASFLLGRMQTIEQQQKDVMGEHTSLPPLLNARSRAAIEKVGLADELGGIAGGQESSRQVQQSQPPVSPHEGRTATGKNGEKYIVRGGKWERQR